MLTAKTVLHGSAIFNCISAEDVLMRKDRVVGLVLKWSPVEIAVLHVDLLSVRSKYVIDTTGHVIEIVRVVQKKTLGKLNTSSGQADGEQSISLENAETMTL